MKIADWAEKRLWQMGFTGKIRRILLICCFTAAALFLLGLIALPFTGFLFWLGAASAFSAWNFFSVAYFIQRAFDSALLTKENSRRLAVSQILLSYLRLFITGLFIYTAFVYWHADPFAIAAGLSLAVIMIPISLLFNSDFHRK